MAAREAYTGAPLEGAIRLEAVFVLPRPKSKRWKTKPMPRYLHIIKPDKDNLEKGLMDALSKLLWVDDCQVADSAVTKFVAAGDEQPHVEIRVVSLELDGRET